MNTETKQTQETNETFDKAKVIFTDFMMFFNSFRQSDFQPIERFPFK
jgi:hypothetical protein